MYFSVALLVAFNSHVIAQTTHNLNAVKSTSGKGLHNSRIFWISWDLNKDNKPLDVLTASSAAPLKGIYTSPAGYKYEITLTTNSGDIVSASTTDYYKNSFPVGYTGFTPSNNILGIKQNPDASTAKFTLEVKMSEPGSSIQKTPKGLVIAGSESLNGTGEYYSMQIDGNITGNKVKVIDKYIYGNTWSNFNVNLITSELGKKVKATQKSTGTGDGKGDVMLLAEDVSSIDIELKGGGGQHIALGFIEDLDYSDAPESYGVAMHAQEANFSASTLTFNGTLIAGVDKDNYMATTSNTSDIGATNGQLSKLEKTKVFLGDKVDSDNYPTVFPIAGSAPNTDDNNGVNDDDAFGGTIVQINMDLLTQDVPIKINTPASKRTYLYIWVDKNRNGVFDTDELIKKDYYTITSSSQTVLVDFKPLNLPKGTNYYTRVRLSTDANLTPTGFASDGEVEDHFINVYQLPFNIYGTVFKDKNAGVPDGIPFGGLTVELYKGNNTTPIATTTTNANGVYYFENLYSDTEPYKVKVIKPFGNYEFVASTDETSTDGLTDVVINGSNKFNVDFGLFDPVCYKDATMSASGGKDVTHGITALSRAGDKTNWPMVRKGAWTALESKNTGFVLNRVAADLESDGGQIPAISSPVKGMMVYDTTNKCLKIYNGTKWHCYDHVACPD